MRLQLVSAVYYRLLRIHSLLGDTGQAETNYQSPPSILQSLATAAAALLSSVAI